MLYMNKKNTIISVLFLGLFLSSQFSSSESYALPIFNSEYSISNLKVLTGEKIKESSGAYEINICSNENKVEMIFDIEIDKSDDDLNNDISKYIDELIVLGNNNIISGEIDYNGTINMTASLNEGNNLIKIKNKENNNELIKLYINYTKVNVKGIPENVSVGDNFNLICTINEEEYKNTKWTAYGIDTLIVSENGNVTIINGGTGRIIGSIYKNDEVIGNVNISLSATGKGKLGWIKNDEKWYYIDPVKKHFRIGWLESNNNWYFMNKFGQMQTGWIEYNGSIYYLEGNGAMARGWIKVDNKWYYMNNNGTMKKGWLTTNNGSYYLDENGVMVNGKILIDNKEYVFNNNGKLRVF